MLNIVFGIIYKLPLERIVGIMILMIFFWRFLEGMSKKMNQGKLAWKCGNVLLFIGILVIIIRITLGNRSSGFSEVILYPFQSFIEARTQPEMYRSMLMNVLLFFPIGLSLPNILPKNFKYSVLVTIIFAFLLSFGVEYLQYYYHLGRTEIDDVLCNTLGCAIGTISYKIKKNGGINE